MIKRHPLNWDSYTVFSLLTGLVLVAAAIVPSLGLSAKERILLCLVGCFCAWYGYHVARATSGTYYFSTYIFLVPIVAVVYVVAKAVEARKRKDS